jgi:ATP-dependent DNA helicase RecG
MNRTDLAELLANGENSGVEFKRDDITPEKLAREMAALMNLEGGHVLLGVEDNGAVSGMTRPPGKAEEWVMEAARMHLRPPAIPFWETIEWESGKHIGIISLPDDAPDKPYKVKRSNAWVTQVRVGTTTRDASDEEELRLYAQSGRLQYDRKPAIGSNQADLDMRRLVNYFRDIRGQECPSAAAVDEWSQLLLNTELMYDGKGRAIPSVAGLLLFGMRPERYLPQAGVSAAAYQGQDKDYDARERASIRGPLVSLFPERAPSAKIALVPLPASFSESAGVAEPGVIEQAMDFVRRNSAMTSGVDNGGRRQDWWTYPLDVVREALVNAIAHRDYTITVTDIEMSLYSDRLEIISPGRLPNTVTVAKMKAGYRASRNELIKEVLRDYRYVEASGLGVPRKLILGMRQHNGTETELIEEDSRFTVRLWANASKSTGT